MSVITVSSSAGLEQALASASAGDTIQLAAGTYSGLRFDNLNYSSAVTITSADPNNQAVLTNFVINNSSGLTFSNLEFFANDPNGYWSYGIRFSHDITLDHLTVHGSLDGNPQNDQDGIGVWDSSNITVTNSEFTELSTALSMGTVNNILVAGNYFHKLQVDGMDFSSAQTVRILNNYITDFYIATGDHPDAIQLWTSATVATKDVIISGNVITRGDGNVGPQGIFMAIDAGSQPFINVNISDNFLVGTGYHGISVLGGFQNVTVNNNQLWSLDPNTLLTWIRLEDGSGAILTNNSAMSIDAVDVTGLTKTGNFLNAPTTDYGAAALNAWLTSHSTMSWVLTDALPVTTTPPPTTTTPPPPTTTTPPPPSDLVLDGSSDTGLKGDGWTKMAVVKIDGVAETGSSVMVYDAGVLVATSEAATGGSFSVSSLHLGDGNHSLTAVSKSASGVVSAASASLNVVVDTVASVLDVTDFSIAKTSRNATTVSVSGAAFDNSGAAISVDVMRDGALIKTISTSSGAWAFTDAAGNGVRSYTMQGTDIAGNVAGAAHSLVIGASGNDAIHGSSGADYISGGGGYDSMSGGGGNDVFVFGAGDAAMMSTSRNGKMVNIETITDFSAGDKLDLTDLGHLTFAGQTQTLGAHQVEWYVSGGNTFVVADVSGDGKADFMVQLAGLHTLSSSDFMFG
jgi:hypothetical protein